MRNIGICFGSYTPLHQGHLDVIMKAKKENDFTYVFVAGYDNDRGGDILPLQKRYRIISNFLEDDLVKVFMINDTKLGLDESMSESNWDIWLNECYKQIIHHEYTLKPKDSDIYNWYVGEQFYKEQIDRYNQRLTRKLVSTSCTFVKRDNPISGTMCREMPLHNWNKITAPFRAYFSHNILISGTASEGKTTLCEDLGRYFSLPYSYEKGRDICNIKSDPEFTIKDFIYNIYEQHKYNEQLICSPQNPGVFVSDTDNIVTLMYAKAYSERADFALSKEEYKLLYDMAKAYQKTTKWNKVFLLAPKEKGIVDDGVRYMKDSDYSIRKEFFDILISLYDDFGIEYEILNGSYYENFCKVKDYINSLYE